MKKILILLVLLSFVTNSAGQVDPGFKPRRMNKAIELFEDGQPIYYTGAGEGGYEDGKRLAKTYADVIMYGGEHEAFDIPKLREFMRGLVEAGPTRSGHRFPAVIMTLPVLGLDASYVKANSWVIEQAIGSGIMGVMLCHARDAEAVRAAVSAMRYPFERPGIKVAGVLEGLRGGGSQGFPAGIWGISPDMYLNIADTWPLNPKGELLLGLKIEDKHGLANVDKIAAVPGVGFAEWGPNDQRMSLIGLSAYSDTSMPAQRGARGGRGNEPLPPVLVQARTKIKNALAANRVPFLNSCNESNVIDMIKEGVMVCTGDEATARKGREFTKRKMPY